MSDTRPSVEFSIGTTPKLRLAALDFLEHRRDRADRNQLGRLAEPLDRRQVAERELGPKIGDASRRLHGPRAADSSRNTARTASSLQRPGVIGSTARCSTSASRAGSNTCVVVRLFALADLLSDSARRLIAATNLAIDRVELVPQIRRVSAIVRGRTPVAPRRLRDVFMPASLWISSVWPCCRPLERRIPSRSPLKCYTRPAATLAAGVGLEPGIELARRVNLAANRLLLRRYAAGIAAHPRS